MSVKKSTSADAGAYLGGDHCAIDTPFLTLPFSKAQMAEWYEASVS